MKFIRLAAFISLSTVLVSTAPMNHRASTYSHSVPKATLGDLFLLQGVYDLAARVNIERNLGGLFQELNISDVDAKGFSNQLEQIAGRQAFHDESFTVEQITIVIHQFGIPLDHRYLFQKRLNIDLPPFDSSAKAPNLRLPKEADYKEAFENLGLQFPQRKFMEYLNLSFSSRTHGEPSPRNQPNEIDIAYALAMTTDFRLSGRALMHQVRKTISSKEERKEARRELSGTVADLYSPRSTSSNKKERFVRTTPSGPAYIRPKIEQDLSIYTPEFMANPKREKNFLSRKPSKHPHGSGGYGWYNGYGGQLTSDTPVGSSSSGALDSQHDQPGGSGGYGGNASGSGEQSSRGNKKVKSDKADFGGFKPGFLGRGYDKKGGGSGGSAGYSVHGESSSIQPRSLVPSNMR